jgi:hypothetical protein
MQPYITRLNLSKVGTNMLGTRATVVILLVMITSLISVTAASQVNCYHDLDCSQYAYTVSTADWQCQDIAGIESILLPIISVGSVEYVFNLYPDASCADYTDQCYFGQGLCYNTIDLGDGFPNANSIACEF